MITSIDNQTVGGILLTLILIGTFAFFAWQVHDERRHHDDE